MASERVRQWLASTWHVRVPAEWLSACLDWLAEENPGRSFSPSELNRQVYEQWLLTDLRDIALPVLPAGTADALTTSLDGHYALQMDSLLDVSQPVYAQLQKLRGRDTSNEQVTATPRPQQPWEVKAGRMLLLQLTDGVQAVQAMEYRPIPALHALLPPGTKLLVSGRVRCRLGMLLLEAPSVSVLGGEVEALVAQNAPLRLLARLVGEAESASTQDGRTQSTVAATPATASATRDTDDAVFPDDFSDDFPMDELPYDEELDQWGATTTPPQPPPPQRQQPPPVQPSPRQQHPVVAGVAGAEFDNEWPMDEWDTELEPEPASPGAEPAGNTAREARAPGGIGGGIGGAARWSKRNGGDADGGERVATLHGRGVGLPAPVHRSPTPPPKRPRPRGPPATVASSSSIISSSISRSSVGLHSPPFTYLSRVLSDRSPAPLVKVVIKGFVVTLLGPLQTRGGAWSVCARVTDGTAATETAFSDQVVTQLIGFSVDEMKAIKRDPARAHVIRQALEQCKRRLVDLCCLMELEFGAGAGREAGEAGEACATPLLVRLQEVTQEHADQLRSRQALP